jgi:hypothetical protein
MMITGATTVKLGGEGVGPTAAALSKCGNRK